MVGKIGGVGSTAKVIIGVSIALLIWAVLGYGVGIFQLYNTSMTVNGSPNGVSIGVPTAVSTVSTLGIAVASSIAVMVKFFE